MLIAKFIATNEQYEKFLDNEEGVLKQEKRSKWKMLDSTSVTANTQKKKNSMSQINK